MEPPPGPYLCISGRISLLSIAESGLQVLMPQPLANGWQAHATINEFSCMCMPELVERTVHSCLRTVMIPAFLYRLVAQWPSAPVLFRSEERPVLVPCSLQVRPKLVDEARIVYQNGPFFVALPDDREVFIVKREVKILYIQAQGFPGTQARF